MLGLSLFTFLFAIAPEKAPPPKLVPLPALQGYYHVTGNEEGLAYEGTVCVERMPTGRSFVRWTIRNQPVYVGIADLEEDRLWIGYHSAGAVGLSRYRLTVDVGNKPALTSDRGAKETWTWLRGFLK
jgi:hypothetical protein